MTQRQMSGMIPAMARYKTGGLPVSVDSLRRQIQLYPENGTSGYEPDINGTIRLQLPSTIGFLDTVNSYLSFRIKVKQNGTTPTANMKKEIPHRPRILPAHFGAQKYHHILGYG